MAAIAAIKAGQPEFGDVRVKVMGMDLAEQSFTVLGTSMNGTIKAYQAEDEGLCGEYTFYEVKVGNFSKEQLVQQQMDAAKDKTNLIRLAGFLAVWAALCLCALPCGIAAHKQRREAEEEAESAKLLAKGMGLADMGVGCLMTICPALAICAGVMGAIWMTTSPSYGIPLLVCFFLSLGALVLVNWRIRLQRAKIEHRKRLSEQARPVREESTEELARISERSSAAERAGPSKYSKE